MAAGVPDMAIVYAKARHMETTVPSKLKRYKLVLRTML
jgi:hypothetical protein